MLANAAKIALAAATLMLFAPRADAQQIHPTCAKFNFRDKSVARAPWKMAAPSSHGEAAAGAGSTDVDTSQSTKDIFNA